MVVAQSIGWGVWEYDRGHWHVDGIDHDVVRHVRQVHHHAQPVHLLHHKLHNTQFWIYGCETWSAALNKGCRLLRKKYRGHSHLGERVYGGKCVTVTERHIYTCETSYKKSINTRICAKTFSWFVHLISCTLPSIMNLLLAYCEGLTPLIPRARGHAVAQLVEALRGFDSRWCQWNVSLT